MDTEPIDIRIINHGAQLFTLRAETEAGRKWINAIPGSFGGKIECTERYIANNFFAAASEAGLRVA